MQQKKAYKYRIYPTAEQVHILARTFGCCRYVYNWALRQRTDASYKDGERLYYEATAQRLTSLKKQADHVWLNDISSVPLQQSLRHLDTAFVISLRGVHSIRSSTRNMESRRPRMPARPLSGM